MMNIIMTMLPAMLYAPLNVYFIAEVLRYKIRKPRRTYIVAVIMGAIIGFLLCCVSVEQTDETITLSDVAIALSSLFLMIYVGIHMVEKKWKRIFIVFMSMDILTDLNSLLSGLKEMIFASNEDSGIYVSLRYTIYTIPAILFEYLMFYLIARMRKKKDNSPLPLSLILGLFLILNIFAAFIPVVDFQRQPYITNSPVYFVFMMSALAFVTMIFYIRAARKERNDLIEMNRVNGELVESEARYFEASVEANKKIRAMKHDMKNNMQVLQLLLEKGDYGKMKEYLGEMTRQIESADVSAHTGDTIADAILADKKSKAESAGITLNVSGVITDVEFSPVDMCKILANILDNAIEAVSDERFVDLDPSYKVIELSFKKTEKFFMISMVNPCIDAPVYVGDTIISSKSNKFEHGFGLKNAREAAEKYGGDMSVECLPKPYGHEFVTEFVFPI
ncbi:MAG: GHKL domain-containing protein [Lachnospiraceae bacterium]|nr:GHKL domain-containing protein [Lachnospiraceae bacterium]